MARYDTINVYVATRLLFLHFFDISRKFTRDYKFTIGESIKKELYNLLLIIYRANTSYEERLSHIVNGIESIELVRIQIGLVHDLKQLSSKQYTRISIDIENISKQLAAWRKYEQEK